MKIPKHTVVIEYPYPEIDRGLYPVKRELGQEFNVFADVYKDGHEAPKAFLKYKHFKDKKWSKTTMQHFNDHRWKGSFTLEKLGLYHYTVEAYPENHADMVSEYDKILEVIVDPEKARYSTWYEMWPRSQGKIEGQSATFDDMIERLKEIHSMGFDVIYLPPFHPIGKTNKKGPNNSLVASPEDPGCPYSIGNEFGGHKAIEPSLGTMDDFRRFVKACNSYSIEVAMDIVYTCSPDHPYLKEHPEWFYHNEDGSIKYAENPPKKYEDVHPFNFYPENYIDMWNEMVSIFTFWAEMGVKIFRVDNPHTKPMGFWDYALKKVKEQYPEAIFLSEAFTHPKMMKCLAKIGFTQSYTYFTWRNTKWELSSYVKELNQTEMAEYFRPNFFTNTPDILSEYLQKGGRNAFKIRLALAATLSSSYGIYNGFELCENAAIPGKEEYINSEKYEFKVWNWDRPGNIKLYIKAINTIRKNNPALQFNNNIEFVESDNENILAYYKTTPDLSNIILCVVNLDPYHVRDSTLYIPFNHWGIRQGDNYTVIDLLSGQTFIWKDSKNYVKLDPYVEPVHIFHVNKWKHYEKDFSL
ncbi:MAG: hypothetical protein ACD_79C00739G0024 [uncultured bacterium]|nr:MAG: hypothetical protein ACD_79C00739G0024 [uncultured bacterium]